MTTFGNHLGRVARLIDAAAVLDAEIKVKENELHCLKSDLEALLDDESGSIETQFASVNYATTCRHSAVATDDALTAVHRAGFTTEDFVACCGVKVGKFKKLVGDTTLAGLRKVTGSTVRFTFKLK